MRMVELIAAKRDGRELTTEQISDFVQRYTADAVPDYQAAALLMAMYIRGMSRRETIDLTMAMAHSGETLDLHDVAPFVVDKHSTGGVGDKTSLVVLPMVAACGVPIGKMSGRGLGSTGGTLDKMESFTGWTPQLTLAAFKKQLVDIGMVLAGQTADLAPADGKLYALRDVTGTVGNKSLIAASIMSKKLAAGADAIVLDVKAGTGAFMTTIEDAIELAQIMVEIGEDAGREVVALVSDMNQPLGYAVGNALEVKEAIATLHGEGPQDFWLHCLEVAGYMLLLAGKAENIEEGRALAQAACEEGRALAKLRQLVVAQGGDGDQVDNPSRLPFAPLVEPIVAPRDGYIAMMDAAAIGWCGVNLGCGRLVKTDVVDPAAGIVLTAKIGDAIEAGQTIGSIHASNDLELEQARRDVLATLKWSDTPVPPRPLFHAVVSSRPELAWRLEVEQEPS